MDEVEFEKAEFPGGVKKYGDLKSQCGKRGISWRSGKVCKYKVTVWKKGKILEV